MKKIISLLICVAITISFTACNQKGNESSKQESDTPVQSSEIEETANGISILAPSFLSGGTFRLVPSKEQLTGEGMVYFSSDSNLSYWNTGAKDYKTSKLTSDKNGKLFLNMITSLSYGCSFTAKNGKITEIIFRPSTVERKPVTDASKLTSNLLSNVELTLAINDKRSKTAGNITPTDTKVIISDTITELAVDLCGVEVAASDNSDDFLTFEGGMVTLNPDAPVGSTAKIGVKLVVGNYRTFTFTKQDGKVSILYKDNDNMKE